MDITDKIKNLQNNFLELNSLFELSLIANQSFTLYDLISNVTKFIYANLNIQNCFFFLKNNQSFYLPFNRNSGIKDTVVFSINDSELTSIFAQNSLVQVLNSDKTPIYPNIWNKYQLEQLDAPYAFAFTENNQIFCICFIGFKDNNKLLNESEINFLKRILTYVEPLFIKLNKKKSEQEQLQNLNKALHNMSILYNISQAVNFIDDLKRLLKVILDKAIETTEAERGSLMLYDFADNTLQVKVVYGLKDKQIESDINNGIVECAKFKTGEGIAGSVFLTKSPIITNLGQNDPRFVKAESKNDPSSLLCVPLIAKGEAIGVINIANKCNNKIFNQQDLEFMEALANQAAIAIDNAKLYELATKDGLTKLYIYRHFYTLLENEMRRSLRYNHPLSLLMLDIDFFKSINDNYGHLVGDQILREIANVISQTIRKIDIPARYGGEEFAIILPETYSKEANIIAERLRSNIKNIKLELDNGEFVTTSVSIGISEFPLHANNAKDLINCADIALYTAKKNGRDCIYGFRTTNCIKVK